MTFTILYRALAEAGETAMIPGAAPPPHGTRPF